MSAGDPLTERAARAYAAASPTARITQGLRAHLPPTAMATAASSPATASTFAAGVAGALPSKAAVHRRVNVTLSALLPAT